MSKWTPQAAAGEAVVWVRVDHFELALYASSIREVLGQCEVIGLPGTRPEVPGAIFWGEHAVAVLDLSQLVPGLASLMTQAERRRTVLLEGPSGQLALPVDSVSEVVRVHEDKIRARELSSFELAKSEVVLEDRVVPLFEPELLLERFGVQVA